MKIETVKKLSENITDNALSKVRKDFSEKTSRKNSLILLSMLLIVMTLAVYWQAGNHEFINFDDDVYVTENSHVKTGLTGENIASAFSSVNLGGFWIPVTLLSHMTDVQFYGMNPGGHHLTSVFIHSISAALLFILLFRLTSTVWRSLFVAALFALHPLHVESVAWVAERKDVLSAFFWFLTLLLYAVYVRKRKTRMYFLTLFSFVLGLMSKPMVVTLPLVMLLLDFWPLSRYTFTEQKTGRGQLVEILPQFMSYLKEKIPFFACSLFFGAITIYFQHKVGAVYSFVALPVGFRIENALLSNLIYIGKTVWPQDLAIFYPFPMSIPLWQVICSLVVLLLISTATVWAGRRYLYLQVGWFWYLITLLPVIGLAQSGSQAIADRYTYIPQIGLFIMVAWGVTDLLKDLPYRQHLLALSAFAVIITSATLTWRQLGYWQDNISLFQHTLQTTDNNYVAHNNLGVAFKNKGYLDAAINEYHMALVIYPDYDKAHNNLGVALADKGYLYAAIKEYQKALTINPNLYQAHINLNMLSSLTQQY